MYNSLLKIKEKHDEMEKQLLDPEVVSDIKKYTRITKEINSIKDIVEAFNLYLQSENNLILSKEMLHEKDEELVSLAKMEIASSEEIMSKLTEDLKILIYLRMKMIIVMLSLKSEVQQVVMRLISLPVIYSECIQNDVIKII
ncbi:Peptide chain release factor 1 [Mycoplasmopsis anatis]